MVQKYVGLEYTGVDFATVNATGLALTTLHVDVWTPAGTQFGVKLVTNAGEFQVGYDNTTIKTGQWISLEIPLTSYTGMDKSTIHELLFVDNLTAPPEHQTFFIDNVYFHK